MIERPWSAPAVSWTGQHGTAWSLGTIRWSLPNPDDRHALATAIAGRCVVIVTCSVRDLPGDAVAPYWVEVLHPDDFLSNHLELMLGPFCGAVHKIRAQLVAPPISVPEYRAILAGLGLVATVADLVHCSEQL